MAIPVAVLLGDLIFRWGLEAPANLAHSPSNLLASVGLSFVLWWAISRLVSASKRRWLWASLIGAPAAFLCAVVWRFAATTGHTPATSALVYLLQEPQSAMHLMGAGVSPLFVGGAIALAATWSAALACAPRELPASLRRSCLLALLPWFFAAVAWPAGMTVGQTPFVTDFHATHTIFGATRQLASGEAASPLGVADRAELPSVDRDTERPNVIVVIAESLRRDRMQIYGHTRPTTPRLAAFFDEHPDEVYRFDYALSASAYTQLSVPMILSGMYMARDQRFMHRTPLLWHYARAAGAQTFLVSPQQWSWQGLDDFMLLDAPPDHIVTADTLGADMINDLGVDDRLATDTLVELLGRQARSEQPFLGVVQTNATHFPFLPKADVGWPQESIRDVYDASVALTDEGFGRMLDALDKGALLDETVIVFVSDHSEFFYDVGADDRERIHDRDHIQQVWQDGLRVSSCHPAICRIPMFVYIPEKWREALSLDQSALRANQTRLVSTVDVVATVLDLWDVEELPERAGIEALDGRSLLEPIAEDRPAFCFNSASWNLREASGFAAFDKERVLYGRTDFAHYHAFAAADERTFGERAPGAPASAQQLEWLESLAEDAPFIKAYIEHVGLSAR